MGVFRAGNGKMCIEPKSFNYDTWYVVMEDFKTQGEFTLKTGITRRTIENFKKRKPITMETLTKLLILFPNYKATDWVYDYNEKIYVDLDPPFSEYKPTKSDMKDCENEILARRKTIYKHLEFRIDSGRLLDIISLIDRMIIEAEYYGTMLAANGRTEDLVKKIRDIRNGKGELK